MKHAVSRRALLGESAVALVFGSAFISGCGGGRRAAQPAALATAAGVLAPEQAGGRLVSQSATWKALPVGAGGFVTGIDFSNDGSTKVVRTDTFNGYVWDDGLRKWRPLFTTASLGKAIAMEPAPEGLSDSKGVWEARVAPSDPNRIYATYEARVYRSDDKGRTFKRTSLPPKRMLPNDSAQRVWGHKMAVDPSNPDVVYVGTQGQGLWRTLDGGTTWSLVADVPNATNDKLPLLIAFDATSGTSNGRTKILYVSSDGNGVYRTADAGATFTRTPGGPVKSKRMICDQTGTLWFLDYGRANNLFKFADGRWSAVPTHNTEWFAIAVDPTDAKRLIMISDYGFILQSLNGGASWLGPWYPTDPDGEGYRIVANDIPWLGFQNDIASGDLRFDPSAGNKLYLAMGVGVMWSNPPKTYTRVDWNSQSIGIEQLVASWILSPPGGDPLVLAWDRPIFKISDVTKFPASYGPAKRLHHGWHAEYAVDDPTFIAGLFNYNGVNNDGWSADGGKTWTKFAAQPSEKQGGCIAVSTRDNIVVAPSNNGQAVYTQDRGRTWKPLVIPGLPTTGESGWGWAHYLNRKIVAADRVKPGVFYIYNYGPETARSAAGVYRSIDGGVTWVRAFSGQVSDWSGYNAKMQSVPGQMGHLFFTSGSQGGDTHPAAQELMRSKDGGSTWTPISKVQEVYALGFGKAAPNAAYPAVYIVGWVNGEYGVWGSFDDCRTWNKLGDYPVDNIDMPNCVSGDMNVFGRFYVGFVGSGFAYGEVSAWAAGA